MGTFKLLSTFAILTLVFVSVIANVALAQIPTSGLRLHLKADAGTSTTVSGQKISTWADQSGNGFQAVEANTNWQPTYIVENGVSMIRFTPSAPTSMNLPSPSDMGFNLSDYEIFIAARSSSSATQFLTAGSVNYHEIQLNVSGARYTARSGNFIDNTNTVNDGGFHVINAIGTTTEATLGIDGAFASLNTDATTSVDGAIKLGTRSDGSFRFDGDIAEILIYNRKLTATESMQVSEYLQAKYSTPFTAYAAPGSPATNIGFSSVTQNSMNISLSKGTGSHRIIIARKGSAVTAVPSNGVFYTGNGTFGSGHDFGNGNYAVYVGTEGTSTALSNLAFNSDYHFAVYEYNIVGGFAEYLSTTTTASQTTSDLTQASNLQISNRTASTFSGSVTQGSGTHRLIVARQGGAVNWGPTDGVTYTGNTAFGSGSEIGTGNYVIHAGTDGTTYSMSSLSASTVYYLAVFEYVYVDGVPKYRDSNPPTASDITFPATPASNIQFSSIGLNEMTVSFTPGNGNKRIVIAREAAAVSAAPTNGQSYSASSVLGNGTDLGSNNYVIYDGTGSSVTLTGLSNSTTYHFAVYEYSEYSGVTSYLITSPATGSNSTTVVPLPVISGTTFGGGTATSREVQALVNPGGFETTVEVIYGTDSGNLNSTTSSQNIGSGSVNDSVSVEVTGLTTGQTYYAKLRATNIRGSIESPIVTLVPLRLTSLQGWYRGDIVEFYSGGTIKTWLDYSGSGRDLSKATTTHQSQTGFNDNPSIIFDGQAFLFLPSFLGIYNTDLEMFIVFKSSSNAFQELMSQSNFNVPIVALNSDNDGIQVNPKDGFQTEVTSGALNAYTDGNGHIMHYKTANNRYQVRIDNEGANYKNGNNRFSNNSEIRLGGAFGESFNGQIAEILFFNAELSFEQRREIAQYLSDRYAISMFVPSVPETAASSLVFSNIGPTNFDVSFTQGDGERRIVVARLNGAVKTAPTANTVYAANANFGSGSDLDNNNYVVYDGTGNSVAVTGLSPDTEYTIDVYEYNNMELDPQYMLSSPNSATQTTQSVSPPTIQLTGVSNLGATSAAINSLINPNIDQTSTQVFYGTDASALNLSTVAQAVGNQSTAQAVNTSLTGLTGGTHYYYKVSATNLGGTTESEIGSFVYKEDISLASLQFWVSGDGATFTSNSGDPVSNWGNQAGKPTKAYQVSGQDNPLRITDSGISFLRFDGSSDFMELPISDSLGLTNSDYEVFIVAKSSSTDIGFLMGGAVGNFELHTRPNSGVGTRFIPKSGILLDNTVNSTDGNFHIFNAKATSEEAMLRIDGNSTSVSQDARSSEASNLILGARRNGSLYFNGDIAEVLIYNSDLTDTERINVEQYLAEKYSVTLPYYLVNSTSDTNTGSGKSGTLRYVLNAINSEAPNSDVTVDMTTISGTITLTSDLPPINYNTTILGPGKENLTISGADSYRPFFIGAGTAPFTSESPAEPTVTFKDFTIRNGLGKGGDGAGGAGGGAGMGGAVFVNAGRFIINSLAFNNNSAVGGFGDGSTSAGGGGGAFGSSGSSSGQGGSGGLIGSIANGGFSGTPGGTGGFGAGGGAASNATLFDGGAGGFGGGGGSGAYYSAQPNGQGGFGGSGGFGAGHGGNHYGGGGGGGGFGGAIFNRLGEILVTNSEFTENSATGGVHNGSGGTNGSSYGGAIFNYEGEIIASNVTYGTGEDANSSSHQPDFYDYNEDDSGLGLAEILPATNITTSSVTINGKISTFGFSGTYHIAYGSDIANLSNTTSNENYNGGNPEVIISVPLSGLSLSSMHFYKIVLVNEIGSFESDVRSVVYDTSISSDSLKLWISADRGLKLSDGLIENWFDASDNQNVITQASTANRPSHVDSTINNNPAVRFNGSSSFLTLPGADDLGIQNSDYELFIVARSSSSTLQFLYSGAGETYELHLNGGLGARVIPKSGTYIDGGSSNAYTNGQARIFNTQITSANGGLRVDNELVGAVTTNTQNGSSVAITMGRRYDGTYYFNGDVAEVIVYNKPLSESERTDIVEYLSQKYDIEPYVSSVPTVHASQPVISEISASTISGRITKGNGAKRLILAKKGSAVDAQPASDQVYTANSAFGSGAEIGTGNFVVYNAADSIFTVSGLEAGNEYHFSVFEYNGEIEPQYLTNAALTFSEHTLSSVPEGLPGSALVFGGNDEDVVVSHTPAFNTSAVTMELWFKSNDSGTDFDFLTSKASEELEIHLGAQGVANTIRFIPASQVYIDSPVGVFTPGEWTHLAVVYDPSNALAKMYINGEEVAVTNNGTNPLTTPRNQSTSPFYLGSRAGSSLYFNGSMDEVRIWNKMRTGDEIREFMHRPVQTDFQDMIAYWQFNEGSGTILADNISGLDGTLQNFEFDANNGWVNSDIAFGSGSFASVDEVTTGTHALSELSITLTEDFDNAVTLTSDYVNTPPNVIPEIEAALEDSYWIVKAVGDQGDFEASLTFTVPSSMISSGTANSSQFKLYRRPFNGTGNWTVIKEAASSFSSNTVSFSGVSELGQFTVGREINIEYAQSAGSAVKFDGVNDYISVPDNDAFNLEKYTLELWFNWNEGTNNVEFLMGKALTEFEIHTIGSNNSIRFIPAQNVFIDSPADAFVSDTWTHLALVYDPSQALTKMYFNGVEVTPTVSGSLSTSLTGSSTALNFGRRSSNELYFNGKLDEIRLWNTVRTPAQIQQDMSATTPSGFSSGLIGYWQFNEGSGTTTAELTNGLSGTLNNFDFTASSGWVVSGASVENRADVQVTLTGTEGWRLLASPIQDSTLSPILRNIWTQGFTGANSTSGSPNVYTWSTTSASNDNTNWVPLTDIANAPGAGSGTLVYVFSDDNYTGPGNTGFPKTIEVQGLEPQGDQTLTPLLNTNLNGFTLLGNPFKRDVDWDDFTMNNLSNTVYVYDHNASGWKNWNGTLGALSEGKIGAFNGFFVQTMGAEPNIAIPANAKQDSAKNFLGKQVAKADPFYFSLELASDSGITNKAWFQFSESGEFGLDASDAHQLQSLSTQYVTLASQLNDTTTLDINSLPLSTDPIEIPLQFTVSESGTFTITKGNINIPEDWEIQLVDNQTGETSDLENGYSFTVNQPKAKTTPKDLLTMRFPMKAASAQQEPRFLLKILSGLTTGIEEPNLPKEISLSQNYPNPFNPSTVISYQLPESSEVQLVVFDVLGREIAKLVNEQMKAGYHQVNFNAGNLASGMYIYRLKAGNQVFTKKLTLIK